MTKTIYKYTLIDNEPLKLPKEARILKVGTMEVHAVLWALVPTDTREFTTITPHIRGTGWDIDVDPDLYFDTVVDPQGFVWHIFLEKHL